MYVIYYFSCILHLDRQVLKDHDYLRLQFLGARDGWLGCPDPVCDLRKCPSVNNNHQNFQNCWGEVFQIIGEGANYAPIRVGQRVRFRYLRLHNTWIGCRQDKDHCEHNTCPGSTLQGKNFNRCHWEMFKLFARGKRNGAIIQNSDEVMLYHEQQGMRRYVSIQGKKDNVAGTSLDFCPGVAPPAFLSYAICSKNMFRIYRRP